MASYNVTYHNVQGSVTSPLNAMYIDESPAADDLLNIEVSSMSGQPITLQGKGSVGASKDNYHFKLLFQTGDLSHSGAIALAADQVKDWDVSVGPAINGTTLYLLRKETQELAAGESFTVALQKVGAAPGNGPRQTHIDFAWAEDIRDTDEFGLEGAQTPVEVINFERKHIPPLSVGFDTTNMVLCDGSYRNVLVLRIVNLGSFAIELDPAQCKLTLSFDTSTDTSQLWALATPNQAKSFFLPGKLDSSAVDDGWSGHGAWDVTPADDPVEWHLTPTTANTALAAGSSLEIPISNIVTEHPTGRAQLRVQYLGFREYDDGQFTVEIQKAPLLYSQVGSALQIRGRSFGLSHANGETELRTYVNNSQGALGTFSSHPFQIYSGFKPWLTLTPDGKLGVGTTTPAATLDVHGNAAVSGTLDFGQQTRQMLALHGTQQGIGVQEATTYFRTSGNFGFYKGGLHSDAELQPGQEGSAMMVIKSGSVGIGTRFPEVTLDVRGDANVAGNANVSGALGFGSNTRQMINLWGSGYGIGVQANTLYLRSGYDFAFFSGGSHVDKAQDPGPGGSAPMVIKGNGQVLINGQSPMVYKYYSSPPSTIDTGWSSKDWFAFIAGFNVVGDSGPIAGLYVTAEDYAGQWRIGPYLYYRRTDSWYATVVFVRREFCTFQQ